MYVPCKEHANSAFKFVLHSFITVLSPIPVGTLIGSVMK